jgi:hypothetical protein
MKLSEAIRLGSTMKPKTVGAMRDLVGTCAIGAAFDAIGKLDIASGIGLGRFFEGVPEGTIQSPAAAFASDLGEIIMDLNDSQKWTREQIADWVELLEGPEPPETIPDPIPAPEEEPIKVGMERSDYAENHQTE